MLKIFCTVLKEIKMRSLGEMMHEQCKTLFPIYRSITGDGFRQSLAILGERWSELKIVEIPTGTKSFDWDVPKEYNIKDAYIIAPNGEKICDFEQSNLHVLGYATPVNKVVSLEELQAHLFSLPEQPNAIPYITSYYKERWGFCIKHEEREKLVEGNYRVVIDSELKDGHLTYGELIIKGRTDKEIFLSTYLCHPSMANNELSGPVVTSALADWILSLTEREYTYRIVFIPETIGSITYLSRNLEVMKKNIIAGFNITCIGDDRCYSYLPSRDGHTLSDRAVIHALTYIDPEFKRYTWLDRGSDERQYCAPGVDLPVATVMRSKYGEYPEYHTSLDDLNVVTASGLEGGFNAAKQAINIVENNVYLKVNVLGEPQLGKRGLYPNLSTKESGSTVRAMMNLISYCDGSKTLLDIAELIGEPFYKLENILKPLVEHGLISSSRHPII